MNVTRAYKFRLYPNAEQRVELRLHLHWAKGMWNDLLDATKKKYGQEQRFSTTNELNEVVKASESGLYSQVAQDIFRRLNKSIYGMVARRKKGINAGFPRFRNIDRMKSLTYPQSGFSLNGRKLKVTPFGEINIKLHRPVEGKVKTLTLKREASDKWYAILTAETEAKPLLKNNGNPVGIDLGLINFAVLSDGTTIKNPKHLKKYADRLANKQRKFSKKKKGGFGRRKAKNKVALLYEKVRNTRRDFLHKLSRKLVNSHSLMALEKLASQEMAEQKYGKSINDAGWSEFISMLSYKAESAGSKVVLVNPANTTKICSDCGEMVEKELHERQHNCSSCGLSMDRDLNAAINILDRATVGQTESNACEEEASTARQVSSMKQEAHTF